MGVRGYLLDHSVGTQKTQAKRHDEPGYSLFLLQLQYIGLGSDGCQHYYYIIISLAIKQIAYFGKAEDGFF